jgi:hypothetical protein
LTGLCFYVVLIIRKTIVDTFQDPPPESDVIK